MAKKMGGRLGDYWCGECPTCRMEAMRDNQAEADNPHPELKQCVEYLGSQVRYLQENKANRRED